MYRTIPKKSEQPKVELVESLLLQRFGEPVFQRRDQRPHGGFYDRIIRLSWVST